MRATAAYRHILCPLRMRMRPWFSFEAFSQRTRNVNEGVSTTPLQTSRLHLCSTTADGHRLLPSTTKRILIGMCVQSRHIYTRTQTNHALHVTKNMHIADARETRYAVS